MKVIDREIAQGKSIRIVLGNHATRKHENVATWLDKHKRFHMHFTPTSSSWLNLVERWFGPRDADDLFEQLRAAVPDVCQVLS